MHLVGNELGAELVDQPSCMCLPDSSMPFTDCVLLWSDGGCRHEFTTHVFELLSELALEVSSLVVHQASRHAKRSNPVFEEVVPDDFRMLAGNYGNDTKSARKNDYEAQLVASIIRKHEQINGCCAIKLSVCARACREVGPRMKLTLAHIASQLTAAANCSCTTSSDTYGSGKCMVRRVTQIWVHLAKVRNQLPLFLVGEFRLPLVSGSRIRVAGNVCRGVRLRAYLTIIVIRLSATRLWFIRCKDNNKALLRPASS